MFLIISPLSIKGAKSRRKIQNNTEKVGRAAPSSSGTLDYLSYKASDIMYLFVSFELCCLDSKVIVTKIFVFVNFSR